MGPQFFRQPRRDFQARQINFQMHGSVVLQAGIALKSYALLGMCGIVTDDELRTIEPRFANQHVGMNHLERRRDRRF